MIKSRTIQDQDREFRIWAEILSSGQDICVVICGGDRPHIGSVALASMAESPHDPRKRSATPSVITVPGHKEYNLALSAAEQLSKALDRTVVVSVGIHIEGITPELITKVEEEFHLLVADLVDAIPNISSQARTSQSLDSQQEE